MQPSECTDCFHYWLLLTAAYGFVNLNAESQDEFNACLRELGLLQLPITPGLFFVVRDSPLVLVAAINFDNILATIETGVIDNFISEFDVCLELQTVAHGPAVRGSSTRSLLKKKTSHAKLMPMTSFCRLDHILSQEFVVVKFIQL